MDNARMQKLEDSYEFISEGLQDVKGRLSILETKQYHNEEKQEELSDCVKILTNNQIEFSRQLQESTIATQNTNKILMWILKSLGSLAIYLLIKASEVIIH